MIKNKTEFHVCRVWEYEEDKWRYISFVKLIKDLMALTLSQFVIAISKSIVLAEGLKDVRAKIFHSIDFIKVLLQSNDELFVPDMQTK